MKDCAEEGLKFEFMGEHLTLLPEKAIYWEEKKTLLLADAHLGKTGHFRKEGIPIPLSISDNDYRVLDLILATYNVERMVVLGDLFHSTHNTDCDNYLLWKDKYKQLEVELVRGNHDVLTTSFYSCAHIKVVDELAIYPFVFSHKPLKETFSKPEQNEYYISGHIHPGVVLVGKAKQQLRLPCFYFGADFGLMPAFGSFTGKSNIKPKAKDHVFVILKEKVCKVGTN